MSTRRRALGCGALAVIATVGVLEVGAYLLYPVAAGQPFSRQAITHRLRQVDSSAGPLPAAATDGELPSFIRNHELHPYVGFVVDASREPGYNRFGFWGDEPLHRRSPDKLIVGVVGGSFALGLVRDAERVLVERLREDSGPDVRQVQLVTIALSGFKQPQQLMAVNYILALGGEFDVVVNVDGFNEVALPFAENVPAGVDPAYPRSWKFYIRRTLSRDEIEQIASIRIERRRIERLRTFFASRPLRYSVFALTLWDRIDHRARQRILRENRKLIDLAAMHDREGRGLGPRTSRMNERLFDDFVETWARGSIQLARLCKANGITYVHALQPNQYVAGSKTFTAHERRIAIYDRPFKFRDAVEKGYPLLVRRGDSLRDEGVRFVDLTMMFVNEPRAVYGDNCCHLNELGYRLVAERIAAEVTGARNGTRAGDR
ncbi:MAG: hypothetical protein V3S47_02480 [Acidobacteriota bacterium]